MRRPTCGSTTVDAQAGLLQRCRRRILGEPVAYQLGAPGRHLVQNCLAVLAAVTLLGGDLASAALALARCSAAEGPGRAASSRAPAGGSTLIDESYNANPASMRAALALLGQAEPAKARPAHRRPRRHARARAETAGAARRTRRAACEAGVDLVFLAGPLMQRCGGTCRAIARRPMPRPPRSSSRCSPRHSARATWSW